MCMANSTDIVKRYNEMRKKYDDNPDPTKAGLIAAAKKAFAEYTDAAKKVEDALTALDV